MQTQTLLTIHDNDYYQIRYWLGYAGIWGRWRIMTGAEIKIYSHGDGVKTQIVGPIEINKGDQKT